MWYSRGPDAAGVPSPPEGDDPEWCMSARAGCSVVKGGWLISRPSAGWEIGVVGEPPVFAQVGCEGGKEVRDGEGD